MHAKGVGESDGLGEGFPLGTDESNGDGTEELVGCSVLGVIKEKQKSQLFEQALLMFFPFSKFSPSSAVQNLEVLTSAFESIFNNQAQSTSLSRPLVKV
jgi:hypothetical protein